MSLLKLNLNKSVIFLLLLMNIALSFALLKHSGMGTTNVRQDFEQIHLLEVSDNQAIINSEDITLCLHQELLFNDVNELGLFVPPYPCGACLMEAINSISSRLLQNSPDLLIIVPPYWQKDVSASFRLNSNVKIVEYDVVDVDDKTLSSIDVPILFTIAADGVKDAFACNKWAIESNIKYIETHFPDIYLNHEN